MDKKNYAAVDIFKFICSIMVIGIHSPILLSYHTALTYWSFLPLRIAVPFFFVSASYFLFMKLKHKQGDDKLNKKGPDEILREYIFRILKLWIIWSVLYAIIRLIVNKGPLLWKLKVMARDFLFSGIGEHLWYLPALITALLLVYLLGRLWKYKWVTFVAAIFYLVGLLGNTYHFLLPGKVLTVYERLQVYVVGTRNGLFFGFIYCALGAWLSEFDISKLRVRQTVLLSVLSFTAMPVEFAVLYKVLSGKADGTDMWLTAVPVTVFIFLLLLKFNRDSSSNIVRLRKMSLDIYLLHPVFIILLSKSFPPIGLGTMKENSIGYFIITTTASVLCAYTYEKWNGRVQAVLSNKHLK